MIFVADKMVLHFVEEEEARCVCEEHCNKDINWHIDDDDEAITACFNRECPLALLEIQRVSDRNKQIALIQKRNAQMAGAFSGCVQSMISSG
jgi:hypothetical protein